MRDQSVAYRPSFARDRFFLHTLCAVDVAASWIELEPLWGKGHYRGKAALYEILGRLAGREFAPPSADRCGDVLMTTNAYAENITIGPLRNVDSADVSSVSSEVRDFVGWSAHDLPLYLDSG